MTDVTAADLLAKQDEVRDLETQQRQAWEAIGRAEKLVESSKEFWRSVRWQAEEAAREYRELEEQVRGSKDA